MARADARDSTACFNHSTKRDTCASPVSELTAAHLIGLWLSLVERLPRVQEAVGSNPTSPMYVESWKH
jgi:hypothetical protein